MKLETYLQIVVRMRFLESVAKNFLMQMKKYLNYLTLF